MKNYYICKKFLVISLLVFGVVASSNANVVTSKETRQVQPNLYAIVIGIGELEIQTLDLQSAKADTLLVGNTLKKNSGALYSNVTIVYLNTKALTTKKNILKELNSVNALSENDLFVLYVSGFERVIDTNYYMLTSNTKSLQYEDIKTDALSRDELVDALEKIPAKNKLLMFDTCYPSIGADLRYKSKDKPNIASIAASNAKQTALKISLNGHSVFANVVSDAIAGLADIDGDGVVESPEFLKYVFNSTAVDVAKFKHMQTPAYYQGGESFKISSFNEVSPSLVPVIKQEAVQKIQKPLKIEIVKQKIIKPKPIEEINKEIIIDGFHFIIDDNSVFMDVKREIKKHFSFTNDKGENLIVFEFYINRFIKHSSKNIKTDKISKIKVGYHGDSFRVVLYMKTKTAYDYEVSKEGLLIRLK